MYGLRGVGLSEVQLSISELSVVGGWVVVGGAQTHFMVGPSQGPTKSPQITISMDRTTQQSHSQGMDTTQFHKQVHSALTMHESTGAEQTS